MSEQKTLHRRHLFVLSGAALATLGLAACGQDDKSGGADTGKTAQPTKGKGCDAPVDAKSKQMRKTLQYVEKSPKAEKNCANCVQYIADKYGDCGGCKLFAGPVQPKGYCASWAAKGGAAPSATASASAS